MINEHDVVVLTRDLTKFGLYKGDRGAVVHCYKGGQGFEVEFIEPPHVLTLERADIKLDGTLIQTEVADLLGNLPEEGLAEVRDFAASLKRKYLQEVS